MLLKVCGMKEERNVLALTQKVKPDLMGLIFYPPSKRYVELANAVFFQKQNKIPKVGVFVNAPIIDILKRIEDFGLTYVQLHGEESVVYVQELKKNSGIKLIKVYRVSGDIDWEYLKEFEPYVDHFLFDTQTEAYGGSGKKFNWELLRTYPLNKSFLLSGGIELEDMEEIKKLQQCLPKFAGLDVNSKFEKLPGVKDIAKLKKLSQHLKDTMVS